MSHAAVVVPPFTQPHLTIALGELARDLERRIGRYDFHFTELIGKRGSYGRLTQVERLRYVESFVEMFTKFRIPIFLRTADAPELQRNAREAINDMQQRFRRMKGPGKMINLADPRTATKLDAMFDAIGAIEANADDDLPVSVIRASEPNQQDGGYEVLGYYGDDGRVHSGMGDRVYPPGICICDAQRLPELQLADFAAWAHSRLEWIASRLPTLSEADRELLTSLGSLEPRYVPTPTVFRELPRERTRLMNTFILNPAGDQLDPQLVGRMLSPVGFLPPWQYPMNIGSA